MKGGVLDQDDPLVPGIGVDQGSPSGDLAAKQAPMRVDVVLCDTCFSACVVGSVLSSSGGMASIPWQLAPDTVASPLKTGWCVILVYPIHAHLPPCLHRRVSRVCQTFSCFVHIVSQ